MGQHGFVRGKSYLTNLIVFFCEVTKKIDKARVVDDVYMNVSKAFEKLLHGGLVWKAGPHRIQGD